MERPSQRKQKQTVNAELKTLKKNKNKLDEKIMKIRNDTTPLPLCDYLVLTIKIVK